MPEVEEMQKFLRLIARLIVARHECTYVRHCKENAPIYMYYVAPETPMMSSVIADCPDLATPNILDKSTPMDISVCTSEYAQPYRNRICKTKILKSNASLERQALGTNLFTSA